MSVCTCAYVYECSMSRGCVCEAPLASTPCPRNTHRQAGQCWSLHTFCMIQKIHTHTHHNTPTVHTHTTTHLHTHTHTHTQKSTKYAYTHSQNTHAQLTHNTHAQPSHIILAHARTHAQTEQQSKQPSTFRVKRCVLCVLCVCAACVLCVRVCLRVCNCVSKNRRT